MSGIQHFAESPEGMRHVPGFIKQLLRDLPTHWEDVKFIQGYPGKEVVIARKSGNKWYVAGINGENKEKQISINLSELAINKKAKLITDAYKSGEFSTQELNINGKTNISMKPNGGFVILID